MKLIFALSTFFIGLNLSAETPPQNQFEWLADEIMEPLESREPGEPPSRQMKIEITPPVPRVHHPNDFNQPVPPSIDYRPTAPDPADDYRDEMRSLRRKQSRAKKLIGIYTPLAANSKQSLASRMYYKLQLEETKTLLERTESYIKELDAEIERRRVYFNENFINAATVITADGKRIEDILKLHFEFESTRSMAKELVQRMIEWEKESMEFMKQYFLWKSNPNRKKISLKKLEQADSAVDKISKQNTTNLDLVKQTLERFDNYGGYIPQDNIQSDLKLFDRKIGIFKKFTAVIERELRVELLHRRLRDSINDY